MNLTKALLSGLVARGVTRVFGVPGREAEAIQFTEAGPGLQFVLARNEFSATSMAIGAARHEGTPQVCWLTLGPGVTHAMTGIAAANLDRYPLVVFAAQLESRSINYNGAHQCLDSVGMVAPVTKFATEITAPEQLGAAMDAAFTAATTAPFGAALISIPIDLLTTEIADTAVAAITASRTTVPFASSERVDAELDNLACLVDRASQPVILAGDGVIKACASGAVRAMAEKLGIPVMTTYSSNGVLPPGHPLNYGTVNSYADVILESNVLDAMFEKADLVLLMGYDLMEHYPSTWRGRGVDKTVVSVSEFEYDVSRVSAELSVIADLRHAAEWLASRCTGRTPIYDVAAVWARRVEATRLPDADGPLIASAVLDAMNRHYGNYRLACDVGLNRHVSALHFDATTPGAFLTSPGLSSFGSGLPLGIGWKLADPDGRVVVMAGDGGFHSNSGDLETAVRLGLRLPIVVLDSGGNSLIERYQLVGDQRTSNPEATKHGPVDFVMLARANGADGIAVTTLAELESALRRADAAEGPFLIHVTIDYRDLYINAYEW
jgi:N2-(2-carboxyethyl)arginine synthase